MEEVWNQYNENEFDYIIDKLILFLANHINDQDDEDILKYFDKFQLLSTPSGIQIVIKSILIAIFYTQQAELLTKLIIKIIRQKEQYNTDKQVSYTFFLNNQISNLLNKFPINPSHFTIHNLNSFFKIADSDPAIFNVIQADDVNLLQNTVILNEISLHKKLKVVSFSNFTDQYQDAFLIEYAAYYKAVNIFKYLLTHHAVYSDNINAFAIAGGNGEIIHLCEKISDNYDHNLLLSIYFHHNALYEWLVSMKSQRPDIDCLISCMKYHNIYVFDQICDLLQDPDCVQMKNDANDRIHDIIKTSIQSYEPEMLSHCIQVLQIDKSSDFQMETVLALKMSSFDCFKVLLKYFDLKFDNFPSKLFLLSMKYCHLSFCKLIDEHFQGFIDYTYQDEKGMTPLHVAVLLKDPNKTKFVLEIYNNNQININVKDHLSTTPFSYASKEGNLDIISMFLSNQGIRVNEHDYI